MTTAVEEPEVETLPEDQPEAVAEPEAETPAPVQLPPELPADCPAHIRQHYDRICDCEREVYGLEGEYLAAKERATEAKKDFESADKRLRRLIASGPDSQRELPFDEPVAEARKPKRVRLLKAVGLLTVYSEFEVEVDAAGDVVIPNADHPDDPFYLKPEEFEVIEWDDSAPPVVENDAWRAGPFSELGLTSKTNDLFAAAGIETIGQLEDLRAGIAEGKADAQWPKGIGPAKVTDLENRLIDWLDKNRDKFGEPVAEATGAAKGKKRK